MLGKADVVRWCLVALLSGEHVLLEDVPGVGKTLVAKALARSVAGDFCSLQFTPDLLPSDILGSSVFDSKQSQFVFHRGPIFAHIVLADEMTGRRRDQSALLEAVQRGASLDRRSDAPAAAAIFGDRDAKPLRVRGDVCTPRKPARSLFDPPLDGLSQPG